MTLLCLIGTIIFIFISLYAMTTNTIFSYIAGIFWVVCLVWFIIYQSYLIIDALIHLGGI